MDTFKNFYVSKNQLTPRISSSFPNLHLFPNLQFLNVSMKTHGLIDQIQFSMHQLEHIIRQHKQDFLGQIGFYLNVQNEQFMVVREAPVYRLWQVSAVKCSKTAQELLLEAQKLVVRHHEYLQTLNPECLQVYLTSDFEVKLSFSEDKVVFTRNQSLDCQEYVCAFRANQLNRLKSSSQPKKLESLNPTAMSESVLYYAIQQFCYLQFHGLSNLIRQQLYSPNRIHNIVVQQKYRLKNRNFDWHWLSTDDANTEQPIEGKMYNNPLCSHFDSFGQETIRQTYEKCRKCGQLIVADLTKIFLYENRFLRLLSRNFVNTSNDKIVYSFKTGAFFYGRMHNFFNYSHMQDYIRCVRNILDRPSVDFTLHEEKIFLNANSLGEMFKVSLSDVINTPVRGMYCKHIGFYDLSSIYTEFLKKDSKMDAFFECPVCNQDIKFSELMFLTEVVSIVGLLIKSNVVNEQSKLIYLLVNHQTESVNVVVKDGGKIEQQKLDVYKSLIDPRRKVIDVQEEKEIDRKIMQRYNSLGDVDQ